MGLDRRMKKSRAQEKKTAMLHGGSVIAGSGSGWLRKGDVRTRRFNIECKRTDARQITLKAETLEKNWAEAWSEGRLPLTSFELGGRRYLVLNEDDCDLGLEHEMEIHGGSTGATAVDDKSEVSRLRSPAVLPGQRRTQLRRGTAGQGHL